MPGLSDCFDVIQQDIKAAQSLGFRQIFTNRIKCPGIIRKLEKQGYTLDVTAVSFNIISWGHDLNEERTNVILTKNFYGRHYPVLKALPEKRTFGFKAKLKQFFAYQRSWQVMDDYALYYPLISKWIFIPKGFIYKAKSIPKPLCFLFGNTGSLFLGSILHDFGYQYRGLAYLDEVAGQADNTHLISQGINFERESSAFIDTILITISKAAIENQSNSLIAGLFADILKLILFFNSNVYHTPFITGISAFHRDFPKYRIMNEEGEV